MTHPTSSTPASRFRTVAFWTATVIVVAEFTVGGVMDVLRLPPFFAIMSHLGYPPYFSAIVGVWKLLGALAVAVPHFPRLKEWAYAGMFFNMTGAIASHVATGDSAGAVVAPTIFATLVVASWALRPPARRLVAPKAARDPAC